MLLDDIVRKLPHTSAVSLRPLRACRGARGLSVRSEACEGFLRGGEVCVYASPGAVVSRKRSFVDGGGGLF